MSQRNWVAKALGMPGSVDKMTLEKEDIILLVQGKNRFDERIYSYVRVPFERLKEVRTRLDSGEKFDLREFGTVIAAGLGEPSEDVRREIAEEYEMIPVRADRKHPNE